MRENLNLVFDFDSTWVTKETLDVVADLALQGRTDKSEVLDQVEAITREGMEGKIPFGESLQRRLALFSPSKEHFDRVGQHLRSHVTPSFVRNRKFIEENASRVRIVSGGFTGCIIPTAEDYGISRAHISANLLRFNKEGQLLGVIDTPLAHAGGKTKAVQSLSLRGETAVIGDGMTDFHIKRDGAANFFFAFIENVSRPPVLKVADAVVANFEELLEKLRT